MLFSCYSIEVSSAKYVEKSLTNLSPPPQANSSPETLTSSPSVTPTEGFGQWRMLQICKTNISLVLSINRRLTSILHGIPTLLVRLRLTRRCIPILIHRLSIEGFVRCSSSDRGLLSL